MSTNQSLSPWMNSYAGPPPPPLALADPAPRAPRPGAGALPARAAERMAEVDRDVAGLGGARRVSRHAAAGERLGPAAAVDHEPRGPGRRGRRRRIPVADGERESIVVRDVGL